MGRRALPKIDPALNLDRYLKTFDELPNPWDAAALFGRAAPLQIEVGSGKGLFLQTMGARRPEHNFLGIEVAGKFARFAAARVAKRNLDNVRVVHGDALRVFRELLPAEEAAEIHVYFPDPWWKKRHRKRRVMTEAFAADIERVLASGGLLHFWTDVEEYFHATVELIAARAKLLEGPLPVPERPAEHDLDYRTHFERRMRLNNEPVYRAQYRKRT